MARALVQLLPVEMAILGLFEVLVLFALIFVMLSAGDPAPLLQSTDLPRDCVYLAAMLAVTLAGTAATIGLYRPEVCLDRRRFLLSGGIAALMSFPAIVLVSGAYRMTLNMDHVLWLVRLVGIWLSFLVLIRLAFSAIAAAMPVARRVLIVGSGARAEKLSHRLAAKRHGLFVPVALTGDHDMWEPDRDAVAHPLSWDSIRGLRLWGVVVAADEPPAGAHDPLLSLKLRGMPVFSDRSFHERHLGRLELEAADDNWPLFADGFQTGMLSRAVKRGFDIAVSVLLTIMTLPLMVIVAIAIRLEGPGPILYRQERTGLHGKSFTLFKFRSMATDAEAAGKPQWAQRRDPRVTRVGAFIRTSRIDELPQLLNVMRGEMSMIGPRPERPIFVEQLTRVIPFYDHRACVKPGLTGWAQVNYPYGASVEDAREKLAYDLYYVKNRGLLLDMVILMATVRVILLREGAR